MHGLYAYLVDGLPAQALIISDTDVAEIERDDDDLFLFWANERAAEAYTKLEKAPSSWNDWFTDEFFSDDLRQSFSELPDDEFKTLVRRFLVWEQVADIAGSASESFRWQMESVLDGNNWSSPVILVSEDGSVYSFTDTDIDEYENVHWHIYFNQLRPEERWDAAMRLSWELASDDWLGWSENGRSDYLDIQNRDLSLDDISVKIMARLKAATVFNLNKLVSALVNEPSVSATDTGDGAATKEKRPAYTWTDLYQSKQLIECLGHLFYETPETLPFVQDMLSPYHVWRCVNLREAQAETESKERKAILFMDIHT